MDQSGERGQQASARTLPSNLRPQYTQPPRPGTPFHVPQLPSDLRPQYTQPPRPGTPIHVPQLPSDLRPQGTQPPRPGTPFQVPQFPSGLRSQYTQPPRPGTPFSVPQSRSDTLLKCGKFKDQDFGSLGFLRPTRHTARCLKPYEDKRFKKPSVLTESSLRNLRALIKTSASKKTPDPMKELEKIKEMNVPLPLKVPEGKRNPLSREDRPDNLETATRKRKREDLSSVLISEGKRGSPTDFGQANTRVPEIPSKHCSGDATENLQEDDPTLATTCADSSSVPSGLVISPHIQASPKPSLSSQGAVGSSTSSQDAQGQSVTRPEVLGLTKCVQGAMRHTTSAQAPQTPPTCVESKIIHVQHSQGDFKIPSSTQGFSALSDCPQKRFKKDHPGAGDMAQPLKARLKTKKRRKAPSDQGGLHCVPLDTESSKPSQEGGLSDLSCPPNGLSLTTSPQESLTPLKVTKGNQQVAPHQEDSQRYSPSPPKDTTQSTSGQVSLSTDPVDQGDLPICPSQSVKGELGLSTPTEKRQRCILKSRLPPKLRFKYSAMKKNPKHSHSSRRRSSKVASKQEDSTMYLSESQSYQCPSPAKKALLTLQQAPKSQIHAKALHRSHENSTLSPSKQEVPGSTNSEQRAPQSSPTLQKDFVKIPFQGAEIRHSPSSQVESRHPISTRKRLRDDPSDQVYPSKEDGFLILPYTKKVCESPSAAEERSVVTTTPQVSPPPSISVQKSLGCSTPDQSVQGPPRHPVSSQEAQGPSQSSPTVLGSSLSAPEPQGPSMPLSVSSQNVPHAQSALSMSKSDLRAEKPSLSGQACEEKPTSLQKHVGLVPQEDLTPSTSCKAPKKSSVSCLLPGGYLPSSLGSPVPSTSTQGYLGTSPPAHGSLRRRSSSVPGILCSCPLAQGTTDTLPSAQGVQESFPSSPRHSKYLPHLRGDLQHSSLSQGILGHALPAQATLETSSCSPGVPGPLVSLQKPLGVSSTASVSPIIQGSLGSLLSSTNKIGSSQPAPKLSETLPPTKTGLEISPSPLVALGPSAAAPEQQGLPSLPQEPSAYSPNSHGALDLSQKVSRNLSLTPSTQCHHRIPPSSESSVAALGSAQGAAGHALSEQQTPEWSRYTQGTLGHSRSGPGDMAPSLSSQGILGQMSSRQMDMGTYSHVLGALGHFTNISAFPGHMLSVQHPVATSSTEQGSLRHLPSAQKPVELSQSAQRAPELPALVKVTARPSESARVALMNPASSQGTLGHFQCAQAALQPFPPSVGALKHSPAHHGAHTCFTPAQGALGNLPSNSKAVEYLRATGGQPSSLSAARALQNTLCAKKPEELPISAPRFLGRSLSVQKAPESLTPSLRNLAPCQSAKKISRTLILSQIALQSAISNPSTSGTPVTLSSSPGNMRLSFLATKTPEHSQCAEDMVVEPSPSARRIPESMSFAQTSLKNSLSGQGIMESLSSSQGGVKPSHSTQGSVKWSTSTRRRVENVSPPQMPRKPLTSLQLSRPSPLSQGPHQDSPSASGPLGPSCPDTGTQRPWPPSGASGNSTSAPGTLQPGPFIPKTQDHLQTSERPFQLPIPEQRMLDPSPSTQGALGLLVSSSEEPSESKHRKPGCSSYVGKDGETSLPDTVAKGTSPSAPQSLFATEALGASSFGQGSQRSCVSPREGVKDSPSAPDAQEPSPSTSQPQPDKNALGNLPAGRKALGSSPSTLGPTDISSFAPVPLGHSSLQIQTPGPLPCAQEVVGSFVSEQGTLGPSISAKSSAELLESTVEAGVPSLSGKDNKQLSTSASGSKEHLPSSGSSASKHYHQIKMELSPSLPDHLIYSPSDQKALGMSKCAQGALENFPFGQEAMTLTTCTQEASKPPLSAQDHVHVHVTDALGPSHSKQGTEKSLLSPLENMKHLASATGVQKPFVDTPGPQDTLPTIKQPLNASISACDTLCPLPSTLESGELSSTLSPGILGPSNSAQRELGYLSTIEQTVEYSPSAPPNTRTLPPPLRCTEKLSLVSSAQETSQSSPGYLPPLISAQGPLKLSTLIQGIPGPSASTQESLECSKSPDGIVRTHQSSQKVHEHLTTVVETVESLSVSGTTVTTSASQPLEHSSLPQVTSSTSLTNQELVGPIPPLQRTLKMSSAQGPLEHVLSVQGKGTKSQSKALTQGQNISAEETLGPSPCTMGVEGSIPCAHKKPGMLSSSKEAKKYSLSSRVALELPISETRTLENLPSDQERTNNFNSFQKTSSHSLPMQSTLKQPSSAAEAQSLSSSTQRINNPFLFSPGALQTSSALSAQKHPQNTSRSLSTLACNQMPLEHSMSVQGILGPLLSTPGSLEQSASFQRKLGHLPCMVESQDTSPSVKGTPGPMPFPSESTGNSGYDQGCQEPSLSISRDLAHLLSTKLYISSQGTLGTSSCNEQSLQHSSSSQELLGASKCAQCTPKQFSSVSDTLGVSPCVPKTPGTLPHSLKPVGLYSRQHTSPAPPTPLQKAVETCLYSKATLELKASAQGSLEPSPSTQMPGQVSLYAEATLGEPITPQETEENLASTKETAQQNLDLFSSSQGYLSISLSAEGTFGSWPSDKGAQVPSLSVEGSLNVTPPEQGTIESLSSAQKASKYQTSSQETLRFSPSTQHTVEHSTSFPSGPEPSISSQKSQETLSSTLRDAKYSPSAPGAQAHLQSPGPLGALPSSAREPQRHSSSTQGTAQSFSPGQGVLAPLQSAQRPLKLSTSSQTMLHPPHAAERAPQPSAAYPAVPDTYVNSQSTRGAACTSPSAAGHLDNSTSAQETPSISRSDQGAVGPCPSAEGTQKISRYAQGSRGHSPYAQGSGEHFLSAQATLGNSTSAEQTVGPLPSMQEPQGSTQSTQMILGSLSSDLRPLKISLSAQGTLGPSSSAQGALGPSLCAQGSLKLSTPEQGTVGTVSSAQKASKHLTSSAQHNVQCSPSSPRAPRSFLSPQKPQETSLSSPGAAKPSPSAPGTEKHPLSVSGLLEPLLSTQGPKALTRDEERTLSVQSSSPSIQNTLGHSAYSTSVSRQYKQTQSTSCHFPSVGEDVESSQSAPGTIGALPPSPPKPVGHSYSVQGVAQSFPCGQGCLAPLRSAQGGLMSSQTMLYPSRSAERAPQPSAAYSAVPERYVNSSSIREAAGSSTASAGHVDHFPSVQGTPSISHSDQGTVEPCLSEEGTPKLTKSSQEYRVYSLPVTDPVGHFLSVEESLGKAKPAEPPVQPLSSSPGPQGSTQNTQVLLGCLPSDPRPLGISLSAQGTQEPWSSIQGALGPSLCAQGSLKLSTSEQRTVPSSEKASKLLTSSQKALRFSLSAQHSLSSLRATGPFISSQTSQEHFSSLPGDVEHSPSVPGVQEHPLSTSGVLGPLLSSQRPKELSTDAEDTLPVQRSLSSLQTPLQQSSYFTKDLQQHKQIQSTLQHLPCMGKDVQSSQPVPRTIGFLQPSHQEPGGHPSILEGTQSFPSVQECVASLQSTKGPLKLFMSSQSKPHSSQSPEWALQSSTPSEAFQQTYKPFMSTTRHFSSFEGPVEDSPSIQGTAGNSKSVPGHRGLPVSAIGAPSSSLSDQWNVRPHLSAEGTPNMPKSSQETIAYSPSVPHTGGHFLSAQTTVVKSTSKKQSVGLLPSPPSPLGSTQNTKDPIGSLFSDRSPLGISLSTKGPVEYSLFPPKPMGLPVSPHGALASASLSHRGVMTHSYSQMPQRTSQSALSSLQHPSSVPVFLDSSQYEHHTPGSVKFPPDTGTSAPCVTGSKETTTFSSGYPEHLLHAGGSPKLSICAQGAMCSISSSQDNRDPWYSSSGDLGTSQLAQKNLKHLSHVRGSMKNSPSASYPAEPSLLNRVPRRLSAHAPGDPERLLSAHCPSELTTSAQRSLDPSGSSTGCLDSLSSSSYILNLQRNQAQLLPVQENLEMSPLPVGTSACLPCGSEPLGIGTLGQGYQAPSRSAQGAESPCLATQGSIGLCTSNKSTLRQSPFSRGMLHPPSHTQGTGTQSTSAQSTGAHSLSTAVFKGYTHHDQNMGGPLKSVQGSPRISLSSQRCVEPSMSPWQLPGYPSSEPGIRKSSTATPGHVISEKVPRELFISTKANVNPLLSYQSTLEPLLSKQVNFVLPMPTQRTLGPSPSCQGPLESLQSAPRVQQMDPPASDSSGYMPSSEERMVISLSGQGNLGPSVPSQGPLESLQSSQRVQQPHPSASDSSGSMLSSKEHIVISLSIPGTLESLPSALKHLVIHLSVQENPVPLLSAQEAGGPCLPSQGTLDLSTCAGGSLGISNPSPPRDFGISPSTPATLGSSPFAQVDLGAPLPVPLPRRPPVSKGVLETATSSQGDVKFLHATQENKKPLLFGQDDLGLWTPCLGTQPSSQFSQEEIKLLPSAQGDFKTAPSTSWPVANLLSASESPGFFTSVHHDAKGSSLSSKNNLGISLFSQKSLKSSETAQISLEHSTSSQGSLRPALSAPGTHSLPQQGWQSMSESAHVTPITPHDCCTRESPYAQIRPRASNSNKKILSCVPFPGGDIRDSLSELDGLKSIHFGKSRRPSSKYVKNDLSSTSPMQRTVPTPTSSELSFISCTSHEEDLRHSSPPSPPSRESSTHSKSESNKTRAEDASLDQACLKSVPSDEDSKLCPSYKKEGETSISDKKGTKHKTEPNGSLSTSEPCTGVCRTSRAQPEGLISPTSHQGIIGWSKSTKFKLEKACSHRRAFHASHSKQKGCQPSSSSKKGLTQSSFSIRGQKQKAAHKDSISPSIFTEGGMGTTTSHEENLPYFASRQRTHTYTSTRRNLKDDPYNQGAIKTSPTDQEHFKTSPDVYGTHEGAKPCSSSQGDVSHLDTTDEWLKHAQEEEKPSISAKGGCQGLISAPIPKEKARSSPDSQQTVSHTISQLDMRSSMYYSGKDTALQDEYGVLIQNPSVLGGRRYRSKLYPTNLQRIPLRKWRFSSNLSPKEGQRPFQSDQHGPIFSYSQYNDMYQPCPQCALQPLGALDDIESLLCTPPNNLGLRHAPGDQWKFRDLFSNPQWIRPLTSALGSHRLSPSAQGGNRAPWPLTWKF